MLIENAWEKIDQPLTHTIEKRDIRGSRDANDRVGEKYRAAHGGSVALTAVAQNLVPSGEWLEFGGGVISGLFNQPGPALSRRRRSRHDNR